MARHNNNVRTHDSGRTHNLILHVLRILQLLSAFTSLVLFSVRLAKIIRLTSHATKSNGAVEGILAAAVLYTILATALQLGIRAGGFQMGRLMLMVLDILFVIAFIIVAILTSPKRHGSSGPCNTKSATFIGTHAPSAVNCNLPWGTFILAIFSTILHAITTAYHAARHSRRDRGNNLTTDKEARHNGGVHNETGAGFNENGV